jgi:hypothetical protein
MKNHQLPQYQGTVLGYKHKKYYSTMPTGFHHTRKHNLIERDKNISGLKNLVKIAKQNRNQEMLKDAHAQLKLMGNPLNPKRYKKGKQIRFKNLLSGESRRLSQGINAYKTFMGRKPDRFIIGKQPDINSKNLIYIGTIKDLWYKSNKFDKITRIHTHAYNKPVEAFTTANYDAVILKGCKISYRGLLD